MKNGIDTADAPERLHARVDNGQVVCPYCGSSDVRYYEEVSNNHKICRIEGEHIVISNECELGMEGFNERLECEDCARASALPQDFVVVFE